MRCSYCRKPYDKTNRIPITICLNKHCICTLCVEQLQNNEHPKCPICVQPFVQKLNMNMELYNKAPSYANSQSHLQSNSKIHSTGQISGVRLQNNDPSNNRPRDRSMLKEQRNYQFSNEKKFITIWVLFFVVQIPFMVGAIVFHTIKPIQSIQSCVLSTYDGIWMWLVACAIFDASIIFLGIVLIILLLTKMLLVQVGNILTRVLFIIFFIKLIGFSIVNYLLIYLSIYPSLDCINSTVLFLLIGAIVYDVTILFIIIMFCCSH